MISDAWCTGDQRSELHTLQVLLYKDAPRVHRLESAGGGRRADLYHYVKPS